MSDLLYNQLNPLVRIEESKLLRKEQLHKMVVVPDFKGAKEVLDHTVYEGFLAEDDFPLNFDYYLRMEQSRLFRKMYELAPEKEVIDIYTMRYTYHNLKLLTKSYMTDQSLDLFFVEDGQYSLASLKSAIKNGTSTSVKGLLLESILEVKAYLANYENVRGIDVIYDRYYLRHQREAAEKLNYPDLTKAVISFIDLMNISMVVRGINQKQTSTFLSTVLSSYGTFKVEELTAFADKPLDEFLTFIQGGNYAELVIPLINHDTHKINLLLLARERDNFLTRLYSVASIQAFGPLPLLALLNAKDIEVRNIQLILAGKKNQFSENLITERMRESHEL